MCVLRGRGGLCVYACHVHLLSFLHVMCECASLMMAKGSCLFVCSRVFRNRIEMPLLSLYLYNEILSASPVGVTRDNI